MLNPEPRIPDRLLTVQGYRLLRNDRPASSPLARGHGGVAILVRDNLTCEILAAPITGVQHSNLEIMWVIVRTGKRPPLLVASAYRVPVNTARQVALDLEDFECQLQYMYANYPRATVVIAADFNCCLLNNGTAARHHPLISLFDAYNLHIVNRASPTYRPAGTLLDVIAVSRPELLCRAGVTRCHYGGPHDITRVALRRGSKTVSTGGARLLRRSISKVDPVAFCQTLRHQDWSSVWLSYGPELKWDHFQRIFLAALDSVAPLRRTKSRTFTGPPLSADTRQLQQLRRSALAQRGRDLYRDINRQCRAAVRRESQMYYERQMALLGRASMWRVLSPVIGRKVAHRVPPNIAPDALNNYYVNVGPVTAASVPQTTAPVHIRLPRVTTSAFKVRPVDLNTLLVSLLTMKPSTSTGDDGISISMLQKFAPGIAEVLLDVVNSSLHTGQVPATWKRALITPIPKAKVAKSPSDTRPISILPGIMKVVERLVQQQLTEYLESHHLFSHHQHGYRRLHSTETALSVITDKALHAMDRGEISLLALLDQSKCFDVVPHQALLDKLQAYGIETEWFENYLTGHSQQVLIRSADGTTIKSAPKPNSIGVYQGGALSCVLYSLFANDLGLYVDESVTLVQYADDVQILISGNKQELPEMIKKIENTLDSLFQWFCHHRMKINEKKTQMIVLGTPAMLRDMPDVTITFHGSQIHSSRTVRNLGVTIDQHLNYQAHIDNVTSKCTGMLIALNNTRHVIPTTTLSSLVQGLVISAVRYCMSVYGSCNTVQIKRIQKVINFCARVVSGRKRRDHVSDVIQELGWMTARQLVEYHTINAVQTVVRTGLPEAIHCTIGTSAAEQHTHDTRGSSSLTLPRIRTEAGRRRLCYRGVKMLNATNVHIDDRRYRYRLRRSILSR